MALAYVTIPLQRRLEFPDSCPFTGSPKPHRHVMIVYPRIRWRLPIPFIGSLLRTPVTRLRIPASSSTANIDRWLGRLTLLFVGVVLIVHFFGNILFVTTAQNDFAPAPVQVAERNGSQPMWLWLFLGGIGLYWICKLLSIFNLRAVSIVQRGSASAELCFKRVEYAREFSQLNQLACHDRSLKARHADRQ